MAKTIKIEIIDTDFASDLNLCLAVSDEDQAFAKAKEFLSYALNVIDPGATKSFTFTLSEPNLNNKILCIKAVRTLSGMGLKEAKDFVDAMFLVPSANYRLQSRFCTAEEAFQMRNEAANQFGVCEYK